jgi:hypothetical protein
LVNRSNFIKIGRLGCERALNPYAQDSIEATLLLISGLLDYINGDADGAREKIEESVNVMNRWRKKR